jgi:SRSO17 transposase
LGKLENGIVSVNAYGITDQITFPLLAEGLQTQNQTEARR